MVEDPDRPIRLPTDLDDADRLAEVDLAILHEKGWIADPVSKAKSVLVNPEGERLGQVFLRKHFGTASRGESPKSHPE